MEHANSYYRSQNFALIADAGIFYEPEHIPYATHLFKIAHFTQIAYGKDFNLPFATLLAWLHDVVEDTHYSGDEIYGAVLSLTKDKTLSKPVQKSDSHERIREQPQEAAIVKMAERIENLANSRETGQLHVNNIIYRKLELYCLNFFCQKQMTNM